MRSAASPPRSTRFASSANSGRQPFFRRSNSASRPMADVLENTPTRPAQTIPKPISMPLSKPWPTDSSGTGLTGPDQAAVGQLEEPDHQPGREARTHPAPSSIISRTIESALASLLDHLETSAGARAHRRAAVFPKSTSLRLDMQQTQSSLENVQGALEHLIDRLAMIENDIRSGNPLLAADAQGLGGGARPAAATASPPACRFPNVRSLRHAPLSRPAALPPAIPAARTAETRPGNAARATVGAGMSIGPSIPTCRPDHPLETRAPMRGA